MSLMKVFKENASLQFGAVITAALTAVSLLDGYDGQYGMCAAFALGAGLMGGSVL